MVVAATCPAEVTTFGVPLTGVLEPPSTLVGPSLLVEPPTDCLVGCEETDIGLERAEHGGVFTSWPLKPISSATGLGLGARR